MLAREIFSPFVCKWRRTYGLVAVYILWVSALVLVSSEKSPSKSQPPLKSHVPTKRPPHQRAPQAERAAPFPPYYYRKDFVCYPPLEAEERELTNTFPDYTNDVSAPNRCSWRSLQDEESIREYKVVSDLFHHDKRDWKTLHTLKNIEVVCSDRSGAIPTNSSFSYLGRISRYFQALVDEGIRHVVFFGDSVMRHQSENMAILLGMLPARVKGEVKLEYIYAGNIIPGDTTGYIKTLFRRANSNSSLIFANFGLHYSVPFPATEGVLRRAVEEIALGLNTFNTTRRPHLVWREGTPMQYATRNGWWHLSAYNCKSDECCGCKKVTTAMREGFLNETTDMTDWNMQPNSVVEDVVATVLKPFGIPISFVYSALAVRSDLHSGGRKVDCTHFGQDALLFMNEAVLKTALSPNYHHVERCTIQSYPVRVTTKLDLLLHSSQN